MSQKETEEKKKNSNTQNVPAHERMSKAEKIEAGWTEGQNSQTSPCGKIKHYGIGAMAMFN